MLLLVGLGNPGVKYVRNRHNVGFMAIDEIASRYGFGPWRKKFQGEAGEGSIPGGGKALLLKPQTYMNESGRSVAEAARFYKIPLQNIVVFHDELDLTAGKLKVKTGGGVAGHNGLKSICAHLGPDFRRVRIGIGHPGDKSRVHGHVLGDFSKADQDWLVPLIDAMSHCAPTLFGADADYSSAIGARLAPPPRRKETKSTPDHEAKMGAQKTAPDDAAPPSPFRDALKGLLGRDK